MIHSYVDYPLRDPSVVFLWFALAGALTDAHPKSGSADMRRNSTLGMQKQFLEFCSN